LWKERFGAMNLRVHDLAQAAGVSTQAVRDYESNGLLPPVPRLANGYRSYTEIHLAALMTIRALKDAGYSKKELGEILDSIHAGNVALALLIVDRHHAELAKRRDRVLAILDEKSARYDSRLLIGQAAARLGVRSSTLRFWETMELFTVARDSSSGFRMFSGTDLDRLATIKRLRSEGHSWTTIRSTLRRFEDRQSEPEPGDLPAPLEEIGTLSQNNAKATALVWSYFRLLNAGGQGDGDADAVIRWLFCDRC
jgi:DNA-binding transcriptional MerR regulator